MVAESPPSAHKSTGLLGALCCHQMEPNYPKGNRSHAVTSLLLSNQSALSYLKQGGTAPHLLNLIN